MLKPLTPNHLAKRIDHQQSAATALPEALKKNISRLQQLTQEIKDLLDNCLPKEILSTLWVSQYEEHKLVLSVQSQTAANHLLYQSNNLITILKQQSNTFKQLKNIDVIVTFPALLKHANSRRQIASHKSKRGVSTETSGKNYIPHGLTETTKTTIAHTIKHVIIDERLKKSLESLIKGYHNNTKL